MFQKYFLPEENDSCLGMPGPGAVGVGSAEAPRSVRKDPALLPKCGRLRIWLCLTLVSLGCLWAVSRYYPDYVASLEPRFFDPVDETGNIQIRYDAFGKGHFGARRSGGRRRHKGLDIIAQKGQGILATKSGRVIFSGEDGAYGILVKLRHPGGTESRYAHLSRTLVHAGQWVTQGDKIGEAGKTGNATARNMIAHLHFEVRHREEPVDPFPLLNPIFLSVPAGEAEYGPAGSSSEP